MLTSMKHTSSPLRTLCPPRGAAASRSQSMDAAGDLGAGEPDAERSGWEGPLVGRGHRGRVAASLGLPGFAAPGGSATCFPPGSPAPQLHAHPDPRAFRICLCNLALSPLGWPSLGEAGCLTNPRSTQVSPGPELGAAGKPATSPRCHRCLPYLTSAVDLYALPSCVGQAWPAPAQQAASRHRPSTKLGAQVWLLGSQSQAVTTDSRLQPAKITCGSVVISGPWLPKQARVGGEGNPGVSRIIFILAYSRTPGQGLVQSQ